MEERVARQTLMLFTIGPVQEFIAQARRTRDLWFGSQLLSELSKTAALQLKEYEGELIFPYLGQDMIRDKERLDNLRVANKILALVRTSDPKEIALMVRKSVTNHWLSYANEAKQLLGDSINQAMGDRQVKDLIEFHAAWTLLENENGYADALKQTERLLDARKSLRDFKQNEPGQLYGEPKSSLDGGRESVLLPSKSHKYIRYGIKQKEKLDAISLVKRLSLKINKQESSFPSVCDMAFEHFKKDFTDNDDLSRQVNNFYTTIRNEYSTKLNLNENRTEDYDSRLFYTSRIEDFVEEQGIGGLTEDERQKIIQSITSDMLDLYKIIKIQPTPYYAFMLCDGDRMGDWLRNIRTYRAHQEFSNQLSKFSSKAREIVEQEREGKLIYSGGDDVMAYMPLYRCLDVADGLQKAFAEIMSAIPGSTGGKGPTLSIGIAIVHMLEPLSEVRKLALRAEKMAKTQRNELAIIYQKRNGGDLMNISLPFDLKPVETIKVLQECFQAGLFSFQFAYELRHLHAEYSRIQRQSSWMQDEASLQTLLIQEVERLAWKKKPDHTSEEQIEKKLMPELYKIFKSNRNGLEQLRLLAEQLIIAVTLEKVGKAEYENFEN